MCDTPAIDKIVYNKATAKAIIKRLDTLFTLAPRSYSAAIVCADTTDALKRLPLRQRYVIFYAHAMQLQYDEIAKRMGISRATVIRLHNQAMDQLLSDPAFDEVEL